MSESTTQSNGTGPAPRDGDPAAIVAASDKIRVRLGWRPEFNNLETITAQALAWETHLQQFKHAS